VIFFVNFRHVSWFKETVKNENNLKKRARSTMGTAQEPLPEPAQYLKKFSRTEIKKCTGTYDIIISHNAII
jgi:hypothetical protein